MSLARLPDWRGRLFSFIAARSNDPFVWGQRDCGLFAADAILAMTGVDIAAAMRGYTTPAEIYLRLRRGGCASVGDYFAGWLSPALRARCGDLILVRDPPLDIAMIADGRGSVWGQDAEGVVRIAAPPGGEVWSV